MTLSQRASLTIIEDVPPGGTTGQVLTKASNIDYDLSWTTGSGGGAVSSVSNSDGSLTISPTTGDVVGSINLANANVFTAVQGVNIAGIASTSTDGLILENLTAALTGARVQMTPRIRLRGNIWTTASGGSTQTTDWKVENLPVSGNPPYSNLVIGHSLNGGAYVNALTIASSPFVWSGVLGGMVYTDFSSPGAGFTLNSLNGSNGDAWTMVCDGGLRSAGQGGNLNFQNSLGTVIIHIGNNLAGNPVCINTTNGSGGFALKVNGTTGLFGNTTVAGLMSTTTFQLTTGATNGYVLVSDASGNGTWTSPTSGSQWVTSSNNVYFDGIAHNNAGKVGINNSSPSYNLDVTGTFQATSTVTLGSTLAVAANTSLKSATYASQYDNGTQTGNFGIDWNNGNKQKVTISGTSLQMTFTNLPSAANLELEIVQNSGGDTIDWAGGTAIAFPGGTAPTLSTGGGNVDIVSFSYTGSAYRATYSLAFS